MIYDTSIVLYWVSYSSAGFSAFSVNYQGHDKSSREYRKTVALQKAVHSGNSINEALKWSTLEKYTKTGLQRWKKITLNEKRDLMETAQIIRDTPEI